MFRYLAFAAVLLIAAVPIAQAQLITSLYDIYPPNPTSSDKITLELFVLCTSGEALTAVVHDFTIDLTANNPPCIGIPEPHLTTFGIGPLPPGTYTVRGVSVENGQQLAYDLGHLTVISLAVPTLGRNHLILLGVFLAFAGMAGVRR